MKREIEGKRILVAGAGKSGIAAARLLLTHGADVILFDEDKKEVLNKLEIMQKVGDFDRLGVVLGKLDDALTDTIDLVVMSPGISPESKFADAFRERNLPIWGEIELAYQLGKGRIAAITGTNGKTTTTTLVGEIFKAASENSFTVGNIGIPYTEIVDETTEDSLIAAEISSFQLETIEDFKPAVSAFLNLTPDHLDRHHSMENYGAAKLRIAENQAEEDTCVLNYDDPYTREAGKRLKCGVMYFSRVEELEEGVCMVGDTFTIRTKENGETKEIAVLTMEEMPLLGTHNVENYLAAIAVTFCMGIPVEVIRKVCVSFAGVAHRIEYVGTLDGVRYYNDSKGTNPDAAIKGIKAMNRPTLLIGGGYDKKVPFDDWILSFDGKVKWLVLIGQTADIIEETARKHGFDKILRAESLKEAMDLCRERAEDGDAVLLSPACASWGMFKNYEVRGDEFRAYVQERMEA